MISCAIEVHLLTYLFYLLTTGLLKEGALLHLKQFSEASIINV